MILINVTYKTKPGERDEFYEALITCGAPKLSREESGNIKYDYYLSVDDFDVLFLVEHWRDQAAFEFHAATEHFARLQALKEEYGVETDVLKVEV